MAIMRKTTLTTPILFLILIFALSINAQADIVKYNLTNMAVIKSSTPNTNYATGISNNCIVLGNYATHYKCYFEIPELAGENSIISANISFYLSGTFPNAGNEFFLTTAFDENTLTWNNAPSQGDSCLYSGTLSGGWRTFDITNCVSQSRYIVWYNTATGGVNAQDDDYFANARNPYVYYNYTATNYTDTNTIIVSNTSDYSDSANEIEFNNPSFYVTTWVNNSMWSWYSPLFTSVYMTDPNGYTTPIYRVWGQNAYQRNYTLSNPILGQYTLKIYCSVCSQTILAQTVFDVVNSATDESFIKFNKDSHTTDLSINYHINSSEYDYNLTKLVIDYNFGYGNSDQHLKTYYLSSYGYNNKIDISDIVQTLNGRGFSTVILIGTLEVTINSSVFASDEILYNFATPTPTQTVNPTPPPDVTYPPYDGSPYPTNTPTDYYDSPNYNDTPEYPLPNPIPTTQPTPVNNGTGTNISQGQSGLSGNVTGLLNTTNNYLTWGTNALNNMTNTIGNTSNALSNISSSVSNYSTIFTVYIPSVMSIIPPELWIAIILGWIAEYILIVFTR